MNSQYYHHYNYCTLYIYSSSIISHTRNNPDPSFIEPSFCDVHRAVPLHEYAHDLQVALRPQSQLWKSIDFPTSLDMIQWLIFHIFVLPLGAGCVGAMSAMSFLRGSWQSRHGDLMEKKVRKHPGRQLESNRCFFCMCFATNQGSWQYSRSRSSFHNIRNLVCSNMQYIWIINQRGVAHHECYM